MSDSSPEPARRPITLDLSTGPGTPGTRKRKGPPPVVVQTINLSTPKPAVDASAGTPPRLSGATPPRHTGGRRDDARRDDSRRDDGRRDDARRDGPRRDRPDPARGGTSLADLLDEATLARLRRGA